MEFMVEFLLIQFCFIQGYPVDKGSETKVNRIFERNELTTAMFHEFTKSSEDAKKKEVEKEQPYEIESSLINKNTLSEINTTEEGDSTNIGFINLPLTNQLYNDYKVLVAAAPAEMTLGSSNNGTKVVIYVIFPDDGSGNPESNNIPRIYFVNERVSKEEFRKKQVTESILVINNNRTVTQLKSRDIAKFVRFKNKLTKRYDYDVTA